MATIASLMVTIGSNISGLTKGLQETQSRLKSFGGSARAAGGALSLGLTLPILGVAGAALKLGMEYEAAMSSIKAVTGSTAEEMKQLNTLALKMGKDTSFSALEAANGMEELLKAGLSTSQVLNGGMAGALALAAAGGIDLKDAAEIASTALNSFKADNLSVMKAADLLAGAANASATSVGELKFSLSAVGSVAAGIGMTFQDTTIALAELANNGLKGSDAGTSLKAMLSGLIPQTKQQTALFSKLGLLTAKGTSAFFDQTGKIKNLKDISGLLTKSMAGMTDEMRFSTMQTLFGSDAIRAANILYKEGAAGVDGMNEAMSKVTAAEVAKEKMDNLKGSIDKFKGSLETAGIQIFQNNYGPLKDMVDWLDKLVNKFIELSPETQQWILIGAGIAAAIGPALLVIGGMATGVSALAGAFAFLISPVGLIVLGIAALIAVGWLVYKNWDKISAFFVKVWNWMGEVASKVWDGIKSVTETVWNAVTGFLSGVWEGIKSAMSTTWNAIKDTAENVWNGLVTFFTETIPKGFNAFVQFFKDLPGKVGEFLYQLFFVDIPYNIGYAIGYMIEYLATNIPKVIQFFKDLPGDIWTWLVEVSTKFATFVADFIVAAVKFGGDVVKSIIDFMKTLPDEVWTWLTNVGTKLAEWSVIALEKAKVIGTNVFNGIVDFVKTLPENVWNLLIKLSTKIAEFEKTVFEKAKTIGAAIFNGIIDFIKTIPTKIDDLLGGIVSKITGIASSIAGAIGSIFGNANKGLEAGRAAANAANASSYVSSPAISIVKHADGGIFTKPTMIGNHLFGENGPEILQPLSKANQGGGSNQPIVIYLDGTKLYEGTDRQLGNAFVAFGGI
jgi:TP901 family phage tail tape measure protein